MVTGAAVVNRYDYRTCDRGRCTVVDRWTGSVYRVSPREALRDSKREEREQRRANARASRERDAALEDSALSPEGRSRLDQLRQQTDPRTPLERLRASRAAGTASETEQQAP